MAVLKVETRNAPTLRMGDSDLAQIGSEVFVIGYPGEADVGSIAVEGGKRPIGGPSSNLEPTINDGTLSARKLSIDGMPLLQTNAAASPGSSGGPAVDARGEVVGLLTLGSTRTQGFHLLVPSNTALEFVRQAGADNQPSLVDPIWLQGLEHYWNQEYADAQQAFTEVATLHAEHSEARRLIAECQQRISAGEGRSGGWRPGWGLAAILGAVIALLLGGGGLVYLLRRRRRLRASTPAAGTPGAAAQATPQPPPRKPTEIYRGSATARLVCVAGPSEGRTFPIGAGVHIGRESARAEVVVDDPQVSGRHAWVGPAGEAVVVRDCDSTNGTFLNDDLSRKVKEVQLKEGDVITLGGAARVKFRYHG